MNTVVYKEGNKIMKKLSMFVLGAAIVGASFDANGCMTDVNRMVNRLYDIGVVEFDIDNPDSITAVYGEIFGYEEVQQERGEFSPNRRMYTLNGRVFNVVDVPGSGIDACGFAALDPNISRACANARLSRQALLHDVMRELGGNNELQVNRILEYLNFEARLGLDNYLDVDHSLRNTPQYVRDGAIRQAIGYLQNIANSTRYALPYYNGNINGAVPSLIDVLGVIQGANVVVVNNAGVVVSRSPNVYGRDIYVLDAGGHYMRLQ